MQVGPGVLDVEARFLEWFDRDDGRRSAVAEQKLVDHVGEAGVGVLIHGAERIGPDDQNWLARAGECGCEAEGVGSAHLVTRDPGLGWARDSLGQA
ncbi:hypothetical protein OG213_43070 [Streptomyces mirabilis]